MECKLLGLPACDLNEGPSKERCFVCILGAIEESYVRFATLLGGVSMPMRIAFELRAVFDTERAIFGEKIPQWAKLYDDQKFSEALQSAMERAAAARERYSKLTRRIFTGEGKEGYRS